MIWLLFFSINLNSNVIKRWLIPQRAMLYISYWLELPGIFLICLSVSFLIIPRALSSMVVVLRCHIFFSFYFKVFVFAYFIIFFASNISIRCHGFLLLTFATSFGRLLFNFPSVFEQSIIIFIINPGEFFSLALTDDLSQYSECKQVS